MRKVIGLMAEHGKAQLLTALNVLSNQPVTVEDDGDRRIVTAMQAARYGYNRRDRTFFAAVREEDGYWCDVPHDDCNTVTFDTFLPQRSWRRRVRFALRADLHDLLRGLIVLVGNDQTDDRRQRLWELIESIVDRAWNGLHMRRRLTAQLRTKCIRQQIRQLLCIDPELLALSRAARICGRYNGIDQRWLTFVWQHQEALARIRAQTPTLLHAVAQHMFQLGVVPGRDPTRECVKWLHCHGVNKRSYLLLVRLSDRPFREVLRRFHVSQVLDALALALWLSESGHASTVPLPSFYRATFDQFASTMTAAKIRERFEQVPKRVFHEAQARLAATKDRDAWRAAALDYRGILDWWQDSNPIQHAHASWERWRVLAEEAAARDRMAMDCVTWPCAIEELRTPEAEVLALVSPLALFDEGRALRHCVYTYVGMCRDDRVRLFSARMWHQGRLERATIGLSCEPHGWRIWDIRGYCNRRMGGHWISLARQVAAAYQRKGASPQLPLPMDFKLDERAS